MGKGDKRTFRGKITMGSYGKTRPKKLQKQQVSIEKTEKEEKKKSAAKTTKTKAAGAVTEKKKATTTSKKAATAKAKTTKDTKK